MPAELQREIFTDDDGKHYHLEPTEYIDEIISRRIVEIGSDISKDYEGKNVVMVGVLKGGVMVLSDLAKTTKIRNGTLQFDFMGVESYDGTESSRKPKITKDIDINVEGKHVIIVEDIVDTGYSLDALLEMVRAKGAASVEVAVMFSKPSRREIQVPVKYTCFTIPNIFVVGRMLDYQENHRNSADISVVVFEDELTSQNPSQEV